MIKKIKEFLNAKKQTKKDKDELMVIVRDLDKKLKIQIDRALSKIEELSQDKLYFMIVENQEEAEQMKEMLRIVKRGMMWSAPNILIMNCPLEELSKDKLKEIEDNIKKLKRGAE